MNLECYIKNLLLRFNDIRVKKHIITFRMYCFTSQIKYFAMATDKIYDSFTGLLNNYYFF